MDISSIGSGSLTNPTAASTSATKSAQPSSSALTNFGQAKSMTDSMLVSLLPSASGYGIGGNLDIYAAVGKQSQGLLAGGRMALEIANISLGIDMKQVPASTDSPTPDSPSATSTAPSTAAPGTPTDRSSRTGSTPDSTGAKSGCTASRSSATGCSYPGRSSVS